MVQIIGRLKNEFQVRHVVLCGASMGGASCLTFAALHPGLVDGVVSMNGTANHVEFENFQEAIRESFGGTKHEASREYRKRSAELWAHRFTMPSAFTVGGRDKSVPPQSVLRLSKQLTQDGRRTLLIHRESGGHSTTYEDATAALEFVLQHVDEAENQAAATAFGDDRSDLRLTLPQTFYAVVGVEVSLYFDNIVLTKTPEAFQFDVQCNLGRTEKRRWVLNAAAGDKGVHSLIVTVSDSAGRQLGRASTKLHIVAAHSAERPQIRLLIVGDSLTHASAYPNELARLLNQPGNPKWKMLGTHQPASAAEGVRHEGYGGWTWQRFVTKYEPNPDGTHRKRSSPFVFEDADGKPKLDAARYFETNFSGERPDVVFFLLGINDCFSANPDDLSAIDTRIDQMLTHAESLVAEIRNAAPKADIAIGVTTPPNARESGFQANYKGRYRRWGWKRIQHRAAERLLRHFADQPKRNASNAGRIYLVPTHLNLDPIAGYPDNNGVHPNALGYRQVGTSLYCWLKWWMAATFNPHD